MKKLDYPYKPTHPGEILKEEIVYRGISQKRLAEQTGISYPMLNEILNGKRPVTETLALLFEAALGVDAEMLVRMQMRYNMQTMRQDKRLRRACGKSGASLPFYEPSQVTCCTTKGCPNLGHPFVQSSSFSNRGE